MGSNFDKNWSYSVNYETNSGGNSLLAIVIAIVGLCLIRIQFRKFSMAINQLEKQLDCFRVWLGHVLRMPDHHLMRRVMLNRVKRTLETLFAGFPNLIVDYSIRMSMDRKIWRSSRPSLRYQPFLG